MPLRLKCKVRHLTVYLLRTQGGDQVCVTEHGKARGSQKYDFTIQEFTRLKEQAIANHMKEDVIDQFERAFNYMHRCPEWIRKGTFNSICGWGWDLSVRNYAAIANAIEHGEQDVKLHGRFSGFNRK
jgi:hypothetical protein